MPGFKVLEKLPCRPDLPLFCVLQALSDALLRVGAGGNIKQALRLAVYEPKREEQVFANVLGHNAGPLPPDAVKRIFERIIDEMRTVQKLKILEEGR